MQAQLRYAAQRGFAFGAIMVFLNLIAFSLVLADIIQEFFEIDSDFTPLMIVTGLFALWAGSATVVRSHEKPPFLTSLLGGLLGGAVMGVLTGLFTFVVTSLRAQRIDIREYLTQLSPQVLDRFAMELPPLQAALYSFGLIVLVALLGAVLTHFLRYGAWRQPIAGMLSASRQAVVSNALVKAVATSPISRWVLFGLGFAFLMWLPQQIDQYWNTVLGTVGIYVLMGLGLNIVVGLAGLLDLGYVGFFAVGAYTVGLLTSPAIHQIEMNFWIAALLGMIFAGGTGVLLGLPVLRLRGDYLAIVTLGFGEIIRLVLLSQIAVPLFGGPQGIRDIQGPILFGQEFSSSRQFLYVIIFACFLAVFVTQRLQNSRIGRAWIAIREDETAARAMGINTFLYKLLAFGVGAAMAGLAGVMFASRSQYTGPEDHTLLVSINVLAQVIVGGMASIPGVVVGAFALKGLPEVLRQLDDYRILTFGALLVVMMILRPEGIWPSQRRRLEMHHDDAAAEGGDD